MAQEVQTGQSKVVTEDGVVTVTTLDVVAPDRIALMLLRGAAASLYSGLPDDSPLVQRAVKDQLLFPFSEA